jgi:hypothetical protein
MSADATTRPRPPASSGFDFGPHPLLIVPGLRNSGPGHWQRHWLRALRNAKLVDQTDWNTPTLGDWVGSLVQSIRDNPGAILIGHSLGCALVAHVARLRGNKGIAGALLVAPADVNRQGPAGALLEGFSPIPLLPLPFPSTVIASQTDPYVTLDRAEQFARSWGASFVNLGDAGHINVDAGYGDWPDGLAHLAALAARIERA